MTCADGGRLDQMATPEVYRTNAFRVTGLDTDLLPRDIDRQVQILQMKAKLEGGKYVPNSSLALDPPPDINSIRAAAQILKDAEQRFLHEIFWVWPEPDSDDDDFNMIKAHNASVLSGAEALDLEFLDQDSAPLAENERQRLWVLWKKSAVAWASVLNDGHFWTRLQERISELNDPRLGPGTILELREELPRAIAKIHAIQAYRSGTRQGPGIASQHALWARRFAGESADKVLIEALRPLRDHVNLACEQLSGKVEGERGQTPRCIRAFLAEMAHFIAVSDSVLGAQNLVACDLADKVASTARGFLVQYGNATDDFDGIEDLAAHLTTLAHGQNLSKLLTDDLQMVHKNALQHRYVAPIRKKLEEIGESVESPSEKYRRIVSDVIPIFELFEAKHGEEEPVRVASVMVASALRELAVQLHNEHNAFEWALRVIDLACSVCLDDELLGKLQADRKTLADHVEENRIFGELEPISKAPSLSTVNGWGTMLYGRTDADSKTGTYLTTRYFTAFWIPLFPLGRYRVKSLGHEGYNFLGKAPLRKFDNVHRGCFLLLLSVWVLSISWTNSSTARPSTDPSPTSTAVQQPVAVTQPTTDELTPASPSPEIKMTMPKLDPSRSNESISQPSSTSAERGVLKSAIEADRAQLAQMESELGSVKQELDSNKTQLRTMKSDLDSVEDRINRGVAVDDSQYERLRKQYNQLVRSYNQLLQEGKTKAAQHDALVTEVNEKIHRYNALGSQN